MSRLVPILLRLAVTGGCLWLAWRFMPPGGPILVQGLVAPGWLGGAVLAFAGILALLTLRLGLLARRQGGQPTVRRADLLRITWAGLAGGQVGIGLVGSDGLRVAMLTAAGWRGAGALRLIVTDRACGLAGLALLAAGALALALPQMRWPVVAACGGAVLILAGVIRWRRGRAGAGAGPGLGATLLLVLLAAAGHLLSVAIFLASARAFGLTPPMPASLLAVPIGLLGAALPVSIGGWGVREAAIAQAYLLLGVHYVEAVGASILFGVVNAVMCFGGLVFVPRVLSSAVARRHLKRQERKDA